ncbi:MAG: hypothetical protein QNJ57_09670 [Flavobacteriaceae bacterium]|nr:hypothetical protein [Flavobacteriaceae bacterium]
MTDQTTTKPPVWFWIVSVVALLWNGMGVNNYIQQAYRTEGFIAQVTPEQLAIIETRPAWATAAFAIAVFSGLLGSLLLLLRKRFASPLLIISFITALLTQIWWFMTDGPSLSDQASGAIIPIVVVLFALLLVWMARKGVTKTWLK